MNAASAEFSSEDEAQILDSVRVWLEKEVRPQVRHFDHADEYPHDIVRQMKELGLFSLMYPQSWGGLGMNSAEYTKNKALFADHWAFVSAADQAKIRGRNAATAVLMDRVCPIRVRIGRGRPTAASVTCSA